MITILARSLLPMSTDEIFNTLVGEFILRFDDGEIETNSKETFYSSFAWAIHKEFPNTPLLLSHHVKTVLGGKRLNSNTHLGLIGNVVWDMYKENMHIPGIRDYISEQVYNITNTMYNDLSVRLADYVVSIDILDFLEVTHHPDVKDILDNLEPTNASIEHSYNSLSKLLYDQTKLTNNSLSKAVQSNLANKNQVLQCVGPRGYLTDIDSLRFNTPVLRSYTKGMRSLHDSMIESRSCAKSLYFSKEPLQDAEYFSRKLQLLAQIIQNLHPGDCGSEEYLLWRVKPPEIENGKMTYEGDIKNLLGKFYLDENTNSLKAISTKDVHLYDKTIKLRSVIAGCKHPDPYGVCSVCFGQLADHVPPNSNLGHMCAVTMTEQSSQSVLSVKHLDGSTQVESIMLSKDAQFFFKTSSDHMSYLFNDQMLRSGKSVSIVLNPAEVLGLTDIHVAHNVRDLTLTRVSDIDTVGFVVKDKNEFATESAVTIRVNNRKASLTYEFLEYIKVNGWLINSNDCYVIDLAKWDFTKTCFILPQKDFNMGDHSAALSEILESRVKEITERAVPGSAPATLVELFDLVNEKLNVNLAVLEIILYSTMIVSFKENNYSLPKPWTEKGLGVSSITIPNRSLSAAMAYEYHKQTILSPKSFFKDNRPSHVMDVMLMPRETLEHMH